MQLEGNQTKEMRKTQWGKAARKIKYAVSSFHIFALVAAVTPPMGNSKCQTGACRAFSPISWVAIIGCLHQAGATLQLAASYKYATMRLEEWLFPQVRKDMQQLRILGFVEWTIQSPYVAELHWDTRIQLQEEAWNLSLSLALDVHWRRCSERLRM